MRVNALLPALGVLVCFMGLRKSEEFKELRVERLVLVDSAGKEHAVLSLQSSQPQLRFLNATGETEVVLGLESDSRWLPVGLGNGVLRLGQKREGGTLLVGLSERNEPIVSMGKPEAENSRRGIQVMLKASENNASLVFMERQEVGVVPRLRLYANANEGSGVDSFDSTGSPTKEESR